MGRRGPAFQGTPIELNEIFPTVFRDPPTDFNKTPTSFNAILSDFNETRSDFEETMVDSIEIRNVHGLSTHFNEIPLGRGETPAVWNEVAPGCLMKPMLILLKFLQNSVEFQLFYTKSFMILLECHYIHMK